MNNKSSVRVGIVGVGNIGSAHASAIAEGKIPSLTLTALCDNDERRADELRRSYPSIPVFENAEKLFASGKVDAVVIATPHYAHPPLAIRAFSYGLHVLTEKPAGVYCGAVREMVDAAKQSGKLFAIMFNQRTNKLFRAAKDLMESGALGDMKRNVWIITNWYRKQAYYDSGAWRASWRGEGGGVLMNQAPHNLDLWQWICGMPCEIYADCGVGRFHEIEVEDEATIFARYPNGATGTFITSTGDYPGTNRLEIAGTLGKLVIENKTLTFYRLPISERNYCLTAEGTPKLQPEAVVIEDESYQGHHRVLEQFGQAILYGEPLVATGEEGLRELTICNAAYLSAWQNRTVSLPLDDKEYLSELQKKIDGGKAIGKARSTDQSSTEYHPRWNTNW